MVLKNLEPHDDVEIRIYMLKYQNIEKHEYSKLNLDFIFPNEKCLCVLLHISLSTYMYAILSHISRIINAIANCFNGHTRCKFVCRHFYLWLSI